MLGSASLHLAVEFWIAREALHRRVLASPPQPRVRITASLSAIPASRGMRSQKSRPGHLGGDRPEFAADARRGVGLEVDHVLMRRSAGQEDHDDRFMRRPDPPVFPAASAARICGIDSPPRASPPILQEVAAAYAVTEPLRAWPWKVNIFAVPSVPIALENSGKYLTL